RRGGADHRGAVRTGAAIPPQRCRRETFGVFPAMAVERHGSPGGHMAHTGSSLSAIVVASVLALTSAPAQGLRLGLLGGTTDLTAGGWSVGALTFPEAGRYAVGAQVGNKGAGAMVERFCQDDRVPIALTVHV